MLTDYKFVELIEITLGPNEPLQNPYGFYDFSQHGIEERRDRGKTITLDLLKKHFPETIAA